MDSDQDGLTDGFEALSSHTDPLAADTDHDGISDAAEWAAHTPAGTIPGIAGVSGLGDHAQNVRAGVIDTDIGRLDRRLREADPHGPDPGGFRS